MVARSRNRFFRPGQTNIGVPIIAVAENTTVLDVTAERLELAPVHRAANYVEAAGLLLALRHGITPAALRRPLATLRPARVGAIGEGKEDHAVIPV